MSYEIINKNGHYEVYIGGQFYCAADSMTEAAKELDAYIDANRG